MRPLHFTHCLFGIVVGAALLVALGVKLSSLALLAPVLACPLMMILMMRWMGGHGRGTTDSDRS